MKVRGGGKNGKRRAEDRMRILMKVDSDFNAKVDTDCNGMMDTCFNDGGHPARQT